MERQEFQWILSSCRNLQWATSIQGKFHIVNKKMQMSNCNILLFSEIKTLKMVRRFIFFIREVMFGIWRKVWNLEKKIQLLGCICIHQVRNKIKIHKQIIFMFNIEEIIDINKIFKNGIFENYLVHGRKHQMMVISATEPK